MSRATHNSTIATLLADNSSGAITPLKFRQALSDAMDYADELANPGLSTPAAPINPVTNDSADTFGWTDQGGLTYANAEITVNGGSSYVAANGNPHTGIGDVAKANGQVGVRYKAVSGVSYASATLYNTTPFTVAGGGGGSYETESQAYFDAMATAGYTLTSGEKTAINNMVAAEKTAGRYSKLLSFKPLLGTAAAHKGVDLIAPGTRDITFAGTWTHSSLGSVADGGNGSYADLGSAATAFTQNSNMMGVYVSGGSADGFPIGTLGSATAIAMQLLSSGVFLWDYNGVAPTQVFYNSTPLGTQLITRNNSSNFLYVNRGATASITQASASPDWTNNVTIGNVPGFDDGFTGILGAAFTGTGFTQSEAEGFRTNLETLMAALGR